MASPKWSWAALLGQLKGLALREEIVKMKDLFAVSSVMLGRLRASLAVHKDLTRTETK
jgi:hypothetical protein